MAGFQLSETESGIGLHMEGNDLIVGPTPMTVLRNAVVVITCCVLAYLAWEEGPALSVAALLPTVIAISDQRSQMRLSRESVTVRHGLRSTTMLRWDQPTHIGYVEEWDPNGVINLWFVVSRMGLGKSRNVLAAFTTGRTIAPAGLRSLDAKSQLVTGQPTSAERQLEVIRRYRAEVVDA